jgi:hypothetical protein
MRRTSLAAVGLACFVAAGAQALTPRPASAAEDPYAGVEVLRGLFASNVDLPPASGGVGSERHAAASMVIPSMPARASAGVR